MSRCKTRHMNRIVEALADGSVEVDQSPLGIVQYLIFEDADCDLRVRLHLLGRLEIAWKLRSLHHVATGLNQLHGQQIVHQDVKPSNILVFNEKNSKIADLGSASSVEPAVPVTTVPMRETRLCPHRSSLRTLRSGMEHPSPGMRPLAPWEHGGFPLYGVDDEQPHARGNP